MNRPDIEGISAEVRAAEEMHSPTSRLNTFKVRALLNYVERIESELAGYRSRDDSGFKRALEAQKG